MNEQSGQTMRGAQRMGLFGGSLSYGPMNQMAQFRSAATAPTVQRQGANRSQQFAMTPPQQSGYQQGYAHQQPPALVNQLYSPYMPWNSYAQVGFGLLRRS